jgi:hypothetical protein
MSCGEHSRYQAECKPCRARRYQRGYRGRRDAAIAEGTWQYPRTAAEVRRHLRKLRKERMSVRGIAASAGVSVDTVRGILNPSSSKARAWVQGPTAVALLAVQPAPTPPAGMLDPTGTARKIQAMVWLGHNIASMNREHGLSSAVLWKIAGGRQKWVSVRVARAVDELYERLSLVRGTGRFAAGHHRRAVESGWHGPLAWEAINDPACRPDVRLDAPAPVKTHVALSAVLLALADPTPADELTIAERVEVVTILVARGWCDSRIGAWLRWGPDAEHQRANCQRFRNRHGITALPAMDREPALAAA